MSDKRITYLGTVTVEPGDVIAFDIPPNADADAIKAALIAAEEERAAAQARETEHLRKVFLGEGRTDE